MKELKTYIKKKESDGAFFDQEQVLQFPTKTIAYSTPLKIPKTQFEGVYTGYRCFGNESGSLVPGLLQNDVRNVHAYVFPTIKYPTNVAVIMSVEPDGKIYVHPMISHSSEITCNVIVSLTYIDRGD